MRHVAVIDYGMGNLRSVSKALEAVAENTTIHVTADPKKILNASHIVFPGVGAIRDCVAELTRLGLDDVIREAAQTKPFLGICLGMQALLSHSEENGGVTSLGIIPGQVRQFDTQRARTENDFKVPHMGWNEVQQSGPHPLWQSIDDASRFYFVHSYFVDPEQASVTAATSQYQHTFTAALSRDNIFAAQFHPEKSQSAGLQLLKNFLNWDGQS
jgi:imidazole glycerol-phosphate synthase subunit HisH